MFIQVCNSVLMLSKLMMPTVHQAMVISSTVSLKKFAGVATKQMRSQVL
jgi:hypothetical protein